MFDFLVIGKGLMGSAVSRYLSQQSEHVAILGPDEPTDWQKHAGVFASHYDQGRITRQLSRDFTWSTLAQRAIRQYSTLKAQSGICFYFPVGGLYIAPTPAEEDYLQHVETIGQQLGVSYKEVTAASLQPRFPFLRFPNHMAGIYEPAPAGYINPRDMLRAQLAIAQQQGATIVRETAVSVDSSGPHVEVVTKEGNRWQAKRVIIATGAFTNCFDLVPQTLPLRVKTETIILAQLPEAEAARLEGMPTLIYKIESTELEDIYLLPPIQYPDGRFYLKMGCNTYADETLSDLEAIRRWFIRGDSNVMLPAMRQALQALLPGLTASRFETKRCVVTYTPHGRPFIDTLIDGKVYLATGGNGSSAKSSDAISHLAAQLASQNRWTDGTLTADLFRIGS